MENLNNSDLNVSGDSNLDTEFVEFISTHDPLIDNGDTFVNNYKPLLSDIIPTTDQSLQETFRRLSVINELPPLVCMAEKENESSTPTKSDVSLAAREPLPSTEEKSFILNS